jgi:hypothetical protein
MEKQYYNTSLGFTTPQKPNGRVSTRASDTLNSEVDGSTDYAAEYAMVIQRLAHITAKLDLKSNDRDLQDVKLIVIDMAHMVGTLVDTTQTLIAEVTHLNVPPSMQYYFMVEKKVQKNVCPHLNIFA